MCLFRLINKEGVYWNIVCEIDDMIDACTGLYNQYTNGAKAIRGAIMNNNSTAQRSQYCAPLYNKMSTRLKSLKTDIDKFWIEATAFDSWYTWWSSSKYATSYDYDSTVVTSSDYMTMKNFRYASGTNCIASGTDGYQLNNPSTYSLIDILIDLKNSILAKMSKHWHQKEVDKFCSTFNATDIDNKIMFALNTITNYLLESTKSYDYNHRDALWILYQAEVVKAHSLAKFLKAQYPNNQITTKLYNWVNGFESQLINMIVTTNNDTGDTTADSLTTFILSQARIDGGSNGRYFIIPSSTSYPTYSLQSVVEEIKGLSL